MIFYKYLVNCAGLELEKEMQNKEDREKLYSRNSPLGPPTFPETVRLRSGIVIFAQVTKWTKNRILLSVIFCGKR